MKAGFLDPLDLRVVNDSSRPIFEVLANCVFFSEVTGREYTILRGTRTDGCSVPDVGVALVGSGGLRAGVLHDILWGDPQFPTEVCNVVFKEALLCCGCDPAVAENMRLAVDLFAAVGGRKFGRDDHPPIISSNDYGSNA